ncbi:hypothetical protein M5689_007507 [Euphorbia peplus]|nr:hypothetical protein M5689_007507 [Euphorbia peplus]
MASLTLSKALVFSAAAASPLPPQQQAPSRLLFNGSSSSRMRFGRSSVTLVRSSTSDKSSAKEEGDVLGAVMKNVENTYGDVKGAVEEKNKEAVETNKGNQDFVAKKIEEATEKANESKNIGDNMVGEIAGSVEDAAKKAADLLSGKKQE